MKRTKTEFERFDEMMGALIKVPHSEIKAKLDKEKAEKARKRQRKAKTTSRGASRDSGDGTD